jgi:hypothetical protein
VTSLEERRVCLRTCHMPQVGVCCKTPKWHAGTDWQVSPVSEWVWMWKKKRLALMLLLPQALIPPTPSGSWLPGMTTGQSNIGTRLHGYWAIQCRTGSKESENIFSWTTQTFCDAPAGKSSSSMNISDYMVTNWTPCFEEIIGYHSHAWEPMEKTCEAV